MVGLKLSILPAPLQLVVTNLLYCSLMILHVFSLVFSVTTANNGIPIYCAVT